ncbi:MAG: hypothetical protein GX638_08985 [Crenarchaeota archaeon]|nr:hypothetical protein [Thermoproteota archaeon]
MRYGEYASRGTFNKLVVAGLKGGLNGLARGGDFIEGFAYGFAYASAYEYGESLFGSPDFSSVNVIEAKEEPIDDRYVLIINVDQPGEGGDDDIFEIRLDKSGNVFGGYLDVGHTWIALIDNETGLEIEAGIGPAGNKVKNAPGYVSDGGNWDVKKIYTLTKLQYENALAKIEYDRNNNQLIYDLRKRNCTDWAIEVALAAGQIVPHTSGKWYFRADNPGQLGEELMKQGGIRNNN